MIETFELFRQTTSGMDILDVTGELEANLARSALRTGQVLVFVPGSTGAVTTIEYEPGVVDDLKRALERLAPGDLEYAHDAAWGDGNGYSHVRAAIVGPSLAIPLIEGRMTLGTWQQVVLVDFDNRPRKRRIIQQIIGEK